MSLTSKRQDNAEFLWKVSNQVYHTVRCPFAITSSCGMGVCSSVACSSCTPDSLRHQPSAHTSIYRRGTHLD